MAATLSYFALLSLFPLILAIVSIAGFLLAGGDTLEILLGYIREFFPEFRGSIRKNIETVAATRGQVGVIAVIGLVWVGTAIFDALEYILDQVWGKSESKLLFRARLIGIIVVIGLGALLIVVTIAAPALTAARDFWLPRSLGRSLVHGYEVFGWIINALVVMAVYLALYHFVPSKRPPLKDVWPGAATAGIVWELARRLFSWYLKRVASFSTLYGSLGIVIGLLVWLYILGLITIIGGEVAAVLSDRRKK